VGSALLRQIESQLQVLKQKYSVDIRLRGVMNSKSMVLSQKGLDISSWRQQLTDAQKQTRPVDRTSIFGVEPVTANLETFVKFIESAHLPLSIIIDCTSREESML